MPKELNINDLFATETVEEKPTAKEQVKEKPVSTKKVEEIPTTKDLKDIVPSLKKIENCVYIGNKEVEIFPTKLKYFRNKTATVYNILEAVPLTDFFAYAKGVFDPERDSDQILYDFLVAVFDDEKLIHKNYDNISVDDIEKILEIFDRVNNINKKKEEARKNRETQMTH